IAMSEASTNLAKLCGLRYGLHQPLEGNFDEYFSKVRGVGYGMEAKRRIILGTYARLAGYRDAYYLKALRVRTKVIEDFKRSFKEVDILAAPTMPTVAPRLDEIHEMEPIQHYMMDVLTVAPNL
ncbi:MAG: Asp-tRNA(Asn)/Glu-tRNA(Gln) amidotransferase subunit GatA, partial [Desulfobacterales bacterium]|nr:Asp-tRNA(Asn)/Glu-tRNA(Gln) amidotransferase subunit GatA [Desulfobacterales bacterium]